MIVPTWLIETRHVGLCSRGWHETHYAYAVSDMLIGIASLPLYHFIKPPGLILTASII